jgi:hypothetical protein
MYTRHKRLSVTSCMLTHPYPTMCAGEKPNLHRRYGRASPKSWSYADDPSLLGSSDKETGRCISIVHSPGCSYWLCSSGRAARKVRQTPAYRHKTKRLSLTATFCIKPTAPNATALTSGGPRRDPPTCRSCTSRTITAMVRSSLLRTTESGSITGALGTWTPYRDWTKPKWNESWRTFGRTSEFKASSHIHHDVPAPAHRHYAHLWLMFRWAYIPRFW